MRVAHRRMAPALPGVEYQYLVRAFPLVIPSRRQREIHWQGVRRSRKPAYTSTTRRWEWSSPSGSHNVSHRLHCSRHVCRHGRQRFVDLDGPTHRAERAHMRPRRPSRNSTRQTLASSGSSSPRPEAHRESLEVSVLFPSTVQYANASATPRLSYGCT